MLAGATGIDFVLLVVAADDGVMPQTREHLAIVDLLGIARGIVALTKADLRRGRAARRSVASEIAERCSPARALAGAEIVPRLDRDRRRHRRAARAPVRGRRTRIGAARRRRAGSGSRSTARFTLAGRRHGRDRHGAVRRGRRRRSRDRQPVGARGARALDPRAEPPGRARRGRRALRAQSGRRRHRARTRSRAATWCSIRELHAPTARIDASCACSRPNAKPIAQWMPVRLHHAARRGRRRAIVLLGRAPIAPGARGRVQLVLEQADRGGVGDRFVVRDTTAQRTIGGGRFLDLRAPARKRRTPERLAQLDAPGIADPERRARRVARLPAVLRRSDGLRARPRTRRSGDRSAVPSARADHGSRAVGDATLALSPATWRCASQRSSSRRSKRSTAAIRICPGIGLRAAAAAARAAAAGAGFLARCCKGSRERRGRARRRLGASARATRFRLDAAGRGVAGQRSAPLLGGRALPPAARARHRRPARRARERTCDAS